MHGTDYAQQSSDYQCIEKAILFIAGHFQEQPGLDEIAESVHLSKYHFSRLFKRWAGISPMQFLQFMTLDYTKQKLLDSRSLLDTALDGGLSGPGRLHDLFVTFEAMTPGEFKRRGAGLRIAYGITDSPFGDCLLAVTERGICHLGFIPGDGQADALEQLSAAWPGADFTESPGPIRTLAQRIFRVNMEKPHRPFNLHLKGTNFQVNVWKALLNIPEGRVACYQDIAAFIGRPAAVRAVAQAIAINPVAFLIPCHRVIAKTGKIHNYRWGAARKKALIGWEAARRASA